LPDIVKKKEIARIFFLWYPCVKGFMYHSCLAKQQAVKDLFGSCRTEEDKYRKIIEIGRDLPKFSSSLKTPNNIVNGCQSVVYLHASLVKGKMRFELDSDALISSGLGAILLLVYDNETPETILKCPPDYLETLGIGASLTPNRANGLYSMHLKMKQEALKLLIEAASGLP
jgi:cysteine desulfuration protein SufE